MSSIFLNKETAPAVMSQLDGAKASAEAGINALTPTLSGLEASLKPAATADTELLNGLRTLQSIVNSLNETIRGSGGVQAEATFADWHARVNPLYENVAWLHSNLTEMVQRVEAVKGQLTTAQGALEEDVPRFKALVARLVESDHF